MRVEKVGMQDLEAYFQGVKERDRYVLGQCEYVGVKIKYIYRKFLKRFVLNCFKGRFLSRSQDFYFLYIFVWLNFFIESVYLCIIEKNKLNIYDIIWNYKY